jgi:LPS-assembly protein
VEGFAPASALAHSARRSSRRSQTFWALLSITTILIAAGHQHLAAQDVTPKAPPPQATTTSPSTIPASEIPDAPAPSADELARIPHATPLPPSKPADRAIIESDNPQSRHASVYYASGNVVLTYQDHILRADSVTYDEATGDVTFSGHVSLSGGQASEFIEASHGTYNLNSNTGHFFDVHGSVALGAANPANSQHATFLSPNPFLFTGKMVIQTGPESYIIYDGSVTSCLLPRPDWQLTAHRINLDHGKAHAAGSTFHLLGLPLLFFPYVSHPVDSETRQSGLIIPVFGYSSASKDTGSKGLTLGEEVYLVLGRSADLTLGSIYYSLRGFSENGTFRYRGPGDDFLTAHFSALQDRGFNALDTFPTSSGGTITENVYTNQGGEDVTASFRRQFSPTLRAVGDLEYLSSYVYREAFTENFNQAVSSDIDSITYLTQQKNGYSLDFRADRYQGLKVVPLTLSTGTTSAQEVKIFHAPSIDFTTLDHPIPGTPLLWNLTSSVAGLKRIQPNFVSSGITERFDLRPELALPLAFAGWHTLSSIAAHETVYSRSRKEPYGANATPIELTTPLNRLNYDLKIDIRPPAIERTFNVPPVLRRWLGDQVRHTVEPQIIYRSTRGVDNFLGVLRFDDLDLASDTDELQYGVTQHLYFRPHPKPAKRNPACKTTAPPASEDTPTGSLEDFDQSPTNDANGIPNASAEAPDLPTRTHARHPDPCTAPPKPQQQQWFSWQLAQTHYFDQTFGGAVIDRRRNIFDTTLNFSGIAFLTEPRSISPLKSSMRLRTSSHTDIEWNFTYDTGASKFNSSNVFLETHEGNFFGGISYAMLNAPGRFYTENIDTNTNTATGLTRSAVSAFTQMRVLLGYGNPAKAGLSAATGAGIDLRLDSAQYITIQTSYNWNCCGITVEYRKYDLGTIRNEGAYRFNFTLANIGTAGNLRRNQSLF